MNSYPNNEMESPPVSESETGPGILVADLNYSYGGLRVLENIGLSVPPGRGVAILGPSGCGKSTLLHIVAGLLPVSSGKVSFNGEDKLGRPGWISYMQQDDLLLPWKTIGDNIALPLVIKGMSNSEAREKVIGGLAEFGLESFDDKYPHQLSGGMRQRASFMRSCMFRQDFLLLDEPFSKLDFLTRSSMHQWFQDYLQVHNPGFLFVTHDPEEAVLLADQIIVLSARPARIISRYEISGTRPRNRDFLATEGSRNILDAIIAKTG